MNTAGSLLGAVQHPLRREVLRYLQEHGTGSASEIARDVGVPVGNLSYHVRRLAQLRLIEEVRTVRRHGALVRVFRTSATFREAIASLLSEAIVHLAALAQTGTDPVMVLNLDEDGVAELKSEVKRVRAQMRERYDETRRARQRATVSPRYQVTIVVGAAAR